MFYVKNKTQSKYKCTFLNQILRSLCICFPCCSSGRMAQCTAWIQRTENTDEHWKTTKREEHSPSFFFICAWFQGGRELVSMAINLISAIKITPPSPSTIFPWKATLNVLINVLRCCFKPFQPASFALSIPQSEDIIHFFQKAGNVLFNLAGV